ncbi:MAG: hypothetical protein JWQ66_3384 [Mucilaginibacter sp.]|nr:hypothetical protein [Mucilaginibacter sp.]
MKMRLLIFLVLISGYKCLYAQAEANVSPDEEIPTVINDSLTTVYADTTIDRLIGDELEVMEDIFGFNVQVFYYTDLEKHNTDAFYTPEVLNNGRGYGTICIGVKLLDRFQYNHTANLMVPVLMAQLFGNAINFLYNDEVYTGISREVFSAFIAGSYLYIRQGYQYLNRNDILSALNKITDTDFGNAINHGTPQVRNHALLCGYNMAQFYNVNHKYFNMKNCVKEAKKYVSNYMDARLELAR